MKLYTKLTLLIFFYVVIAYLLYALLERSIYFYHWQKDSIVAYCIILTFLLFAFIMNLYNKK